MTDNDEGSPTVKTDACDVERRAFLAKSLTVVTAGVVVAVPLVTGLVTILSPLGKGARSEIKVRLASLDDLPEDGTPRRYDVVAERKDAWTLHPEKRLGSVYLRRIADGGVVAFNTSCPHAGCSVGYQAEKEGFFCPCHESLFGLDGGIVGESPSPRPLDTLEIDAEKLAAGEVWVTFVNYKTGVAAKEEIS